LSSKTPVLPSKKTKNKVYFLLNAYCSHTIINGRVISQITVSSAIVNLGGYVEMMVDFGKGSK
jgi:hypothetical protein